MCHMANQTSKCLVVWPFIQNNNIIICNSVYVYVDGDIGGDMGDYSDGEGPDLAEPAQEVHRTSLSDITNLNVRAI